MASRRVNRRFSLDSSGYPLEISGVKLKPKSIIRRSSDSRTFQKPKETQLELLEKQSSVSRSRSLKIEEEAQDRSDGSGVHKGFKHQIRAFHRLFPEVPEAEELEHVFTCALQKELIYHGRMFVSSQHICFHSTLLLKETKVIIHMSSVQTIKKKHTAMIVPNALAVITNDGHKYLFVSLLNREVCFRRLSSLCPQLQVQISSRKSSTEHTPDADTISSQSSVDENHENYLIHWSEESESPQLQTEVINTLTHDDSRRKNTENTKEPHDTAPGVSWASVVSEKVRSLVCSSDSLNLNKLLLFYLILVVLLLLSSGYIGLRIVALEEQLSILGSLPEFTLQTE